MRYTTARVPKKTRGVMATFLEIAKKNMTRPMLKRNTDKWRSVGAISTAPCMAYFWVPRNKNERTRARSLDTIGI